MDVSDSEVDQAVIVALSESPTGVPMVNVTMLRNHYGGERAAEMQSRVAELLAEAMRIDLDWSKLTLIEGTDYAEAVMSERHPFLSAQSLRLIGDYFSYQWW